MQSNMYPKSPFSPSPIRVITTDFRTEKIHCRAPFEGNKFCIAMSNIFLCLLGTDRIKTELCAVCLFFNSITMPLQIYKIFKIYLTLVPSQGTCWYKKITCLGVRNKIKQKYSSNSFILLLYYQCIGKYSAFIH